MYNVLRISNAKDLWRNMINILSKILNERLSYRVTSSLCVYAKIGSNFLAFNLRTMHTIMCSTHADIIIREEYILLGIRNKSLQYIKYIHDKEK